MAILRTDQENSTEYFEDVCNFIKRKSGQDIAAMEQEMAFTNASILLDDGYISLYVNDDNFLMVEVGDTLGDDVRQTRIYNRYILATDAADILCALYMAIKS